ncbi:MAG: Com family DNA-binding transcriptional regulator, partial [Ilumatobacteraceae bacterium]
GGPGPLVDVGRPGGRCGDAARVLGAGVLMDLLTVTCPRCGAEADERFYGPCTSCRTELRAKFLSDGRVVEVAEYEPKMNVTPNAVALKDD